MTRGNQREVAREKNLKKQKEIAKKKPSEANVGLSLEQRKQRDADIMRQKQLLKKEGKMSKATGAVAGKK